MAVELKRCSRCGEAKDVEQDFYKRNPRGTGYRPNSWCKACDRATNTERTRKMRAALKYVEDNNIEV